MYKVLGSPKTRAGRVIWMLEELGQPYEVIPASPRDPEIAKLSPTGKVPVLTDGDLTVFDSAAILTYLADKHGALTFPLNSPERTRMVSVIAFALDDVEQPLWTAAKHSFALPEELRALDAVLPALHHEWSRAMTTLERLLGDGPHLMGEPFTIADIVVGHLGVWGRNAGFPAPPPAVADYLARVLGRPAWKAVIKAREAA